jgi:hypothetical protein
MLSLLKTGQMLLLISMCNIKQSRSGTKVSGHDDEYLVISLMFYSFYHCALQDGPLSVIYLEMPLAHTTVDVVMEPS